MHRRTDLAGQLVVARAVVEQHDLHSPIESDGLDVERGDEGARIIVQERDQHRQPRARAEPRGVVEHPFLDFPVLDRGVHAGAPCKARTMCSLRDRMPAASRAKAHRP